MLGWGSCKGKSRYLCVRARARRHTTLHSLVLFCGACARFMFSLVEWPRDQLIYHTTKKDVWEDLNKQSLGTKEKAESFLVTRASVEYVFGRARYTYNFAITVNELWRLLSRLYTTHATRTHTHTQHCHTRVRIAQAECTEEDAESFRTSIQSRFPFSRVQHDPSTPTKDVLRDGDRFSGSSGASHRWASSAEQISPEGPLRQGAQQGRQPR